MKPTVFLQLLFLNTKLVGKVKQAPRKYTAPLRSRDSRSSLPFYLPGSRAPEQLPAWVLGRGVGRRASRALPGHGRPQAEPLPPARDTSSPGAASPPSTRQGRSSQALPTDRSVWGADGKMGVTYGKTRRAQVTASQRETGRSAAGAAFQAPRCCPWRPL